MENEPSCNFLYLIRCTCRVQYGIYFDNNIEIYLTYSSHAKPWAACATVHVGLHSPVQRATSVLCSRAGWIWPFAF
jgi:hypothetical protein